MLDVLNGVAVHGVRGDRARYRPVRAAWLPSADPLAVAAAVRDRYGLTAFYGADLDGILHARPNWDVWQRLAAAGFGLTLDIGLRTAADGQAARGAVPGAAWVLGLETSPGPAALAEAVTALGDDPPPVFSLDLKDDRPMTGAPAWAGMGPLGILHAARRAGLRRFLLLDVGRVGSGEGLAVLDLCRAWRAEMPGAEVWVGGGVRSAADLDAARAAGADRVLVASLLLADGGTVPAFDWRGRTSG